MNYEIPEQIKVDTERYEELKDKEHLLEKFISRLEDVIEAYKDEDTDLLKDLKYEVESIKVEL